MKRFLKLCGIFEVDGLHYFPSYILQMITIIFVVVSMGFFVIASIVYSLKYQDISNVVKSAGFSYNNTAIVCITYIYLICTRSKLWKLIEDWENTIQNSFVYYVRFWVQYPFHINFFFLLGINRRPATSIHYENRRKRIAHLLEKLFLNAIALLAVSVIPGVVLPVVYLLMGNFDPKTWTIMYDQFV